MPRIIQDSDDEDDTVDGLGIHDLDKPSVIEPHPDVATDSTHNNLNSATPAQTRQSYETRGTSSSEALRRDIQAAHIALFEPTPSTSDKTRRTVDDLDVSNTSIIRASADKARLKRTRTTGSPSAIKNTTDHNDGSLKTYGATKRRKDSGRARFAALSDVEEAGGDSGLWNVPSSAKEETVVAEKVMTSQSKHSTPRDEISPQSPNSKRRRTTSRLPNHELLIADESQTAQIRPFGDFTQNSNSTSEIENYFATHNPKMLFPDSSNAATTQPSLPNPDVSNPITANECVILDALDATPNTTGYSSSLIQGQNLAVSDVMQSNGNPTGESHDKAIVDLDQTLSMRAEKPLCDDSCAQQGRVGTLDQTVIVAIPALEPPTTIEEYAANESSKKRKRMISRKANVVMEQDDGVETREMRHDAKVVVQDDASLEEASDRPKRQKTAYETTDKTDSEELDVELPKELYKPRPSRSRGVRLVEENSVDLTVSPVKKSKSKLRRRKTTGGISAYSSALREMGFRSSPVEEALVLSNGNLDEALEWLTSRNDAMFAAQNSGSPASSLKLKAAQSKLETLAEDQPEHDMHDVEGPDNETHVSGSKRKRGRPKKHDQTPAAEKVVEQQADETHKQQEIEDQITYNSTAVTIEKRTRGRSRKSATTVTDKDEAVDELDIGITEVGPTKNVERPRIDATSGVLGDLDPNSKLNVHASSSKSTSEAAAESLEDKTGFDSAKSPEKSTPMNSEPKLPEQESTPASIKQHSPINKGKIPFKVGLSKRARIVPLLRIIKK